LIIRCVVCRNGVAVEMSFDHKPEDEVELRRIRTAGGKVTPDGRVNGGLNLSRAIGSYFLTVITIAQITPVHNDQIRPIRLCRPGDHAYKRNESLSLSEQMISPQPDVKVLDIDPTTDDWMILACDGIWNFMSSQEVRRPGTLTPWHPGTLAPWHPGC
jgi:protein phosphatase 1G